MPNENNETVTNDNSSDEVKLTDEQQKIIDEKIAKAVEEKNKELEEINKKYNDLAKKNAELNNNIINEMLSKEGIELNERQLSFITSVVKDMTVENMEKIKETAFELLNRNVEIKDSKGSDNKTEESKNPIGDPLGLLE